ncbi:MAG TPA: flagellar biosynthesis protein FlhF [Nitrospirae bacterium]|nr:flagellar biosynthesis protein FlhF [Nitrospirota bacterium]
MQIKRYEAVDMNEAVQLVKRDMGPEAVILSTRTVNKGGARFGLFGRQVVEVTAAVETPSIVEREVTAGPEKQKPGLKSLEPLKAATAAIEPVIDGIGQINQRLDSLASNNDEGQGAGDRVSDDVRELKSMISFLIDQSLEDKLIKESKSFLALSRYLQNQGIAPEYIQGLIQEIKDHVGGGPAPDLRTLIHIAASRMRDCLTFDGWIHGADDQSGRKVVALIGPTGVGKTTTIAKLASGLTMKGKKVGLITIDTYRIAAVEQLKIYAKILNIPLEVVLSPGDLKNALRSFRNAEVVLIDTAGRSQRDIAQLDDLGRFLDAIEGVETRLTLSASASDRQMEETIRNFSKLRVDGLIFTKLDEAVNLGPVYNQHVRTGIPISYFTTGQRVPEDIEEAGAKRLIGSMFKPDQNKKQQTINHN